MLLNRAKAHAAGNSLAVLARAARGLRAVCTDALGGFRTAVCRGASPASGRIGKGGATDFLRWLVLRVERRCMTHRAGGRRESIARRCLWS
jgi:hypothetical protein